MSRSLYASLHRRFGAPEPAAKLTRRIDERRLDIAKLIERGSATHWVTPRPTVIVVGAGFAGLAATWLMTLFGFEVTLLEARSRIGGRVRTLDDLAPGRLIEGGAELIGANHRAWVELARHFGLGLSVITPESEFASAGLQMRLVLDGQIVGPKDAERIYEEMQHAFDGMSKDAATISDPFRPWDAPRAAEWDALPLSQWIADRKPTPLGKAALEAEFGNNNAERPENQSYLANLALVRGGVIDHGGKSMDFWNNSETFRCDSGNAALAERLVDAIRRNGGAGPLIDMPARSLTIGDGGVTVEAGAQDKPGATYRADYVVLAVPPSVWNRIAISPALPNLVPNMGAAVKYLSAVERRFWITGGNAPSGMSDEIGMIWEGTDNQIGGTAFELSLFAGGNAARRIPTDEQQRRQHYDLRLEALLGGYANSTRETRFMDWPESEWTKGGYSCPAPGQVTTVGPFMDSVYERRMVFAGEHTCLAFFGFMEGALQSGLRAALKVQKLVENPAPAQVDFLAAPAAPGAGVVRAPTVYELPDIDLPYHAVEHTTPIPLRKRR